MAYLEIRVGYGSSGGVLLLEFSTPQLFLHNWKNPATSLSTALLCEKDSYSGFL